MEGSRVLTIRVWAASALFAVTVFPPVLCTGAAKAGQAINLSSHPQLFLDEFLVARMHNVQRVLRRPTKHPDNPLPFEPEYAWEQEGSDSVNEGPEPLYHDGRTFVTYSASQCADPGYKLGLLELVGADPMNASSWQKSPDPVFQAANGAYGTAHNGFFLSPDGTENWLVYHATTNPNGSCWTDRTTRIQRFDWNPDGTPNFGVPLDLSTDIVVPSGE